MSLGMNVKEGDTEERTGGGGKDLSRRVSRSQGKLSEKGIMEQPQLQ